MNKMSQQTPKFEVLFGILFLVLAGLIFLNSGLFAIKHVIIKGNIDIPSEDILLSAKLNNYKNIFQVNIGLMKQSILENPRIATVTITRQIPDKIIIIVKERQSYCLLAYKNNFLIVGEDSVIIGVKDENELYDLPIVTGVQLESVKIGEKINNLEFNNAIEILDYADENLRQMISEFNLSSYQLYLDLPNSKNTIKVELGNSNQLEKKIYNLRAILTSTSPNELEKIDLRVPDLATVIRIKTP